MSTPNDHTLEARMVDAEKRLTVIENRPLVGGRAVAAIVGAFATSVFAAGMWAQNIQGKQAVVQASQVDMKATLHDMADDLKQLTKVDRLQDQITRVQADMERMREEIAKK